MSVRAVDPQLFPQVFPQLFECRDRSRRVECENADRLSSVRVFLRANNLSADAVSRVSNIMLSTEQLWMAFTGCRSQRQVVSTENRVDAPTEKWQVAPDNMLACVAYGQRGLIKCPTLAVKSCAERSH